MVKIKQIAIVENYNLLALTRFLYFNILQCSVKTKYKVDDQFLWLFLVSTLKACLSQSFFDMLKRFRESIAFPGQLSPSVCRPFSSIDLGSTVAVVIPFNASTHVYFSLYSSIWKKFSETYCAHRAAFIMSFGSHICDKVS